MLPGRRGQRTMAADSDTQSSDPPDATRTPMKEAIRSFDPGAEFYTPEECYIIELSNAPDDPQVSIARARVAAGVTTRWHRLAGTTERYVIIEGRGRVEVGSAPPQDVGIGDVVLI